MPRTLFAALWLVACADPESTADTSPPKCDGKLQVDEVTVDAPFDQDGDGRFDGNNADCLNTYPRNILDCDDANADIGPHVVEIPCNGVDDDCNASTIDSSDSDRDGVTDCEDCNDHNARQNPLLDETCFDGIDNDCDSVIDEDCGPDYNGTFAITPTPQFQCGALPLQPPLHVINFTEATFLYNPPAFTFVQTQNNTPPALEGSVNPLTGAFTVSFALEQSGVCNEYYTLTGMFDGADSFTATLTADWQGNFTNPCFGCTQYEIAIQGERVAQ